jgi:putative effector of murein hydrolase
MSVLLLLFVVIGNAHARIPTALLLPLLFPFTIIIIIMRLFHRVYFNHRYVTNGNDITKFGSDCW